MDHETRFHGNGNTHNNRETVGGGYLYLVLHKVIKGWTIMTSACPAWEFAAHNRLLKSICDLQMAFMLPYIYDYITKL
jgi:hypothetical protein